MADIRVGDRVKVETYPAEPEGTVLQVTESTRRAVVLFDGEAEPREVRAGCVTVTATGGMAERETALADARRAQAVLSEVPASERRRITPAEEGEIAARRDSADEANLPVTIPMRVAVDLLTLTEGADEQTDDERLVYEALRQAIEEARR